SLSVIFFCQAEDGIRDRNVTGVQTCALPIFRNVACLCVKRMVLDFATNALTLKHIAETCNVSDHTVQRVINGAGKDLKPSIFDEIGRASCRERGSIEESDGT